MTGLSQSVSRALKTGIVLRLLYCMMWLQSLRMFLDSVQLWNHKLSTLQNAFDHPEFDAKRKMPVPNYYFKCAPVFKITACLFDWCWIHESTTKDMCMCCKCMCCFSRSGTHREKPTTAAVMSLHSVRIDRLHLAQGTPCTCAFSSCWTALSRPQWRQATNWHLVWTPVLDKKLAWGSWVCFLLLSSIHCDWLLQASTAVAGIVLGWSTGTVDAGFSLCCEGCWKIMRGQDKRYIGRVLELGKGEEKIQHGSIPQGQHLKRILSDGRSNT